MRNKCNNCATYMWTLYVTVISHYFHMYFECLRNINVWTYQYRSDVIILLPSTRSSLLYICFWGRIQQFIFWHELGRHKSYGRENTGKLYSISTRIHWNHSRTPTTQKTCKTKVQFCFILLNVLGDYQARAAVNTLVESHHKELN